MRAGSYHGHQRSPQRLADQGPLQEWLSGHKPPVRGPFSRTYVWLWLEGSGAHPATATEREGGKPIGNEKALGTKSFDLVPQDLAIRPARAHASGINKRLVRKYDLNQQRGKENYYDYNLETRIQHCLILVNQ